MGKRLYHLPTRNTRNPHNRWASKKTLAHPTSTTLDVSAHKPVIGAFKQTEYKTSKEGDEPTVTVGVISMEGQSVLHIDAPDDLADLEGQELLDGLAQHPTLKIAIRDTPTAGQAILGFESDALRSVQSEGDRIGLSGGISSGFI